jgi:subtilisin family serine protease
LFNLLAGAFAYPAPALAQDTPTTTYFIRFQPQISSLARNAWLAEHDAELISWLPQIGVAEVRFGAHGIMASAAADGETVAFLEPDVPVSGASTVTDPGFVDATQGYAQQLLDVEAAWDITKGSDETIIAIIDSGINPQHPEFTGRIVDGYDFINLDDDPTDDHGHGTHVAGIAAAGINGVGTVGVCPQCKIMPVKVLNQRNGGTWGTVSKGILFAVDNGADVINLSLGATITSTTLVSSVEYALAHNVVIVAAAGNMGSNTQFYPAALPGVIGVSGTDSSDTYWPISNYGGYIDVAAPAVNIYSAYHDLVNSSGYAYMSGTSMASPFVAGLAGLIRSRLPDASVEQVTLLMQQSAVDLGEIGRDDWYGAGRVDAQRALIAANDGVDPVVDDPTKGDGSYAFALYLPSVAARR